MKIRYLVVDDTPFVRELVKAVMGSMGHLCVGEASDGTEALDLVTQTLPDLVFMDLVMPKMNGVVTTRHLRDLWPEVKVIALTTLEPSDLADVDHHRFDAWISKPFQKEQLQQMITDLFRNPKEDEVRK